MDTQSKATQRINEAAKIVWKQRGYDKIDLPEITPDKLRQWMPQISHDELMPFYGRCFANCAEIPKDDESGNWIEIAWYRLVRCQLQHADNVPIKNDEVTTPVKLFPDDPNPEALVTKTVITNEDEIEPRTITNIAMMAILEGWDNDSKMAYFHPDEVSGKQILEMVNTEEFGMNNLEDGIIAIHRLWSIVNDKYKGEFYHPLEPIVEAYLQETTAKHITQEYDQKHTVAILQRDTMGSIRNMPNWISRGEDIGQLRISAPAPKIDQIPLFETDSVLPDALPIEYIRIAEGAPHTTKSGHVAMPIRLFFEAIMALEPKETRTDIHFRLGDLLQYLNPGGKYHRKKHLPYVLRGLHSLYYLRIPYRENPDKPSTEVDWIPVLPRTVPNEKSADDASIVLEVRLPPDAAGGMMVEKEILRLTGKKSSARFNAYLTACWIFDKYGTYKGGIVDPTKPLESRDADGYLMNNNERIYSTRGTPLKDPYSKQAVAILDRVENAARICYPTLSFKELTRACYPAGHDKRKQRTYQKRALEAWNALEVDGFVRIEKFSDGWRIMPSKSHVGRYRALK